MINKDIEKIIERVQSDSNKKTERYLGILQEQTKDGFKIVKEGVDSINQRLDVVQSDIEIMKSDIGIIKTDLKQKVDRTEFATLERRVVRLESKVK